MPADSNTIGYTLRVPPKLFRRLTEYRDRYGTSLAVVTGNVVRGLASLGPFSFMGMKHNGVDCFTIQYAELIAIYDVNSLECIEIMPAYEFIRMHVNSRRQIPQITEFEGIL
jgi:putative cofactor-binding repeat protein